MTVPILWARYAMRNPPRHHLILSFLTKGYINLLDFAFVKKFSTVALQWYSLQGLQILLLILQNISDRLLSSSFLFVSKSCLSFLKRPSYGLVAFTELDTLMVARIGAIVSFLGENSFSVRSLVLWLEHCFAEKLLDRCVCVYRAVRLMMCFGCEMTQFISLHFYPELVSVV